MMLILEQQSLYIWSNLVKEKKIQNKGILFFEIEGVCLY
jgi:hypothetical protein